MPLFDYPESMCNVDPEFWLAYSKMLTFLDKSSFGRPKTPETRKYEFDDFVGSLRILRLSHGSSYLFTLRQMYINMKNPSK